MGKPLLSISQLSSVPNPKVPGYFVISTAPINVEGDTLPAHSEHERAFKQTTTKQQEQNLNQIADLIYQKASASFKAESKSTESVEIIISTNGFSTSQAKTQQVFEQIHNYINSDSCELVQAKSDQLIFIGYRWSSEPLVGDANWVQEKLFYALAALPLFPRMLLICGTISILISLFFKPKELGVLTPFSFFVSIVTLILTTLFFFVITLVVLRLFVYFRDNYRATNFGIPDLVELIRQLDQSLVNKAKEQYLQDNKLILKLRKLLLKKLQNQLSLEGILITKQEEAILEVICQQIVNQYCKDKAVGKIKIEELVISNFESSDSTANRERFDSIIKIAEQLIRQEKDLYFIQVRERAIQILEQKAQKYWEECNRIKLTFIGHSLGGYVVTSCVRILSDVFDLNSIGTLGLNHKLPSSNIGRVFSLERLVLVSPDIPLNAILSGRANFLRSSLRRFKETYLFSNEGDLALRLASTLANYFSFPARTRESGYRLGNVSIKDNCGYGIVNLKSLYKGYDKQESELLNVLTIDSFNRRGCLANLQENYQIDETEDREQMAKLFTYFDCTDYSDRTTKANSPKRQVLSLAKWRWELRWIYYIRLTIAYALGINDTHGGYFDGVLSQQLMYRLAFLGFGGLLDTLNPDNRVAALEFLSQECREKKIQVILSPERYKVDILGSDRKEVRKEMLNT